MIFWLLEDIIGDFYQIKISFFFRWSKDIVIDILQLEGIKLQMQKPIGFWSKKKHVSFYYKKTQLPWS